MKESCQVVNQQQIPVDVLQGVAYCITLLCVCVHACKRGCVQAGERACVFIVLTHIQYINRKP